ncbi:unnamed protein product [Thlaspi arvense]|uniref:FBD domain-containing protein n=1 Tax=Thlaspi arvense TaxID=13288 RepID=A0AAU9SSB3_THLAR|nr:unnamed protein product [Thlaspi arvense]
MLLHKAPALVSLKLKLSPKCTADDVGLWMKLAVDRNIRKLKIRYVSGHGRIRLSKRLRTCKTLVALKLKNVVLEAFSHLAGFSSLRTLYLGYVKYSGDESLRNLVSSCPSLQHLVVKRHNRDHVKRFEIVVRYLQSLRVYISPLHDEADSEEYVLKTPNLKYLNIEDHCTGRCSFEDMPYLEEANLDVAFTNSDKIFESLTSVKKLSLCLKKSKLQYPEGITFSRLVHLELCTCDDAEWLNLLMHLLRDSPKLRVLKLNEKNHDFVCKYFFRSWVQQPSYVPECLTQSLEVFEWRNFKGTFKEMDLAAYILKNGLCLKKSLVLHEAPVIETLNFRLGKTSFGPEDIRVWIKAAHKRCVRKLIIEIDGSLRKSPAILPRGFYTDCRVLVELKLNNAVLANVSSSVSFPSLRCLNLLSVKYPGDDFVKRFLFGCPVLEHLVVEQCRDDNVTVFAVRVPSLKSLLVLKSSNRVKNVAFGFVINAPSLERLDIVDDKGGFCIVEDDMPKLIEANVDVNYLLPGKILGSITSTKRLYLCSSISKDEYPFGSVFHRLVHLTLCTCETEWLNLLLRLLRDSPRLQSLKLEQCHHTRAQEPRPCWSEPISVPECVTSRLETLEWVSYGGAEEEKELVAFVLRSGHCVKKVTISSNSTDPNKKLEMIKKLSSSPRRSPTCELIFD